MLGRALPDILGPHEAAHNCLKYASSQSSSSSDRDVHAALLAPSGEWLCAETKTVAATSHLTACLARARAHATTSSPTSMPTTGLFGQGLGDDAPSTPAMHESLAEHLIPEFAGSSFWAQLVEAGCCGQRPDCPAHRDSKDIRSVEASDVEFVGPYSISARIPVPVASTLQSPPTNSAGGPHPHTFADPGSPDFAETPPPEPPVSSSSFQVMRRDSGGSSTDSLYDLSPASSLKSLGGSDQGGSNGGSTHGKCSRSNSGCIYSRDSSCERSSSGRDSSFGRSDSYGSSGASSCGGSSVGESHFGSSRGDDTDISNVYKYARSARVMHLPSAATGKLPSHALAEREKKGNGAESSGSVPGLPSLVSSRRRLWSIAHSGEDMEEGFSSGGAFERDFRDQRRQARGPTKYGCCSFDDDDSSSDSSGGGGGHDRWHCSPPLKSQSSLVSLVDGLNLQSSVALHQLSVPAPAYHRNGGGEVLSNPSSQLLAAPNIFALPQDNGNAFGARSELEATAPALSDWGWFTEEDDLAPTSGVCI